MRTLYIAGFRVFGRALTTTPTFGPSVLPPRLSPSLIVLPRPSVATSPSLLGGEAQAAWRGAPAPPPAEAGTISEGGGGIKERRAAKIRFTPDERRRRVVRADESRP